MKYIKDRKKRLALAVLLAMLISILAAGGTKEAGGGVTGFWGMLYPQYCFSETEDEEAQEAAQEEETEKEAAGTSFLLLELLFS